MLRKIKIYITIAATMLLTVSCLDKEPQSAIRLDKAMQSFDDAEQTVTGIYALLKSGALYSGYLTLLPDIQADLVYAVDGYSNTYGSFWLWQIRSTTSEVGSVYGALYNVIANCNFYLDRIGGVMDKETNDEKLEILDTYTGEVYAIRALAYSELIKCFCEAYDPDNASTQLGVVLRSSYERPEPIVRASLEESYQFVLNDLAKAEALLVKEDDMYSSVYATQAMAYALHARVALYMQDWEAAIDYSTRLIENKEFSLSSANTLYTDTMTYFDYMWNYDLATEIIYRVGFTNTSYGGALGSVFLNFTTDYTYFYPDYVPAQWVLNLYSNADMRYNSYFYTAATGHSHGLQWPLLMKYYGNQEFISSSLLYHVSMPKPFRLAEQYLIRAEAYCRQNKFSEGSKDISTLRQARFSSGGSLNLTADNFLQQISDERVRELYMEGFRLQDLKRWGKEYNEGNGFERTPQTSSLTEGSSLKVDWDNPLFVWPIPRHEIEAPGANIKPNKSN
ncbi:MAG: RagB/SusD family nutrient uptake outer membrane protein [Alistipes sp.]|nr:RagB/SusD family nutrient uptake outer membrane protein [Alistipes sp.]